jgi:hypothetical protein
VDEIAIEPDQFDRFRVVISPKSLQWSPNGGTEIEDRATSPGILYHAPDLEKRRIA